MNVLPMGRDAVLVESIGEDPARWSLGLRQLGLPGIIDVVPAAETVLVRCESAEMLAEVVRRLCDVDAADISDRPQALVRIPVVYDGEDIADIAKATNLSEAAVINLHVGADYTVAFCGFAPGFGYLRGLPRELHMPRRPTPRTRIPAGSVAIASEFSAVYPSSSPGGWHIIGRTNLSLFDAASEPPAVLQPGTHVRFVRQ
jgi:KipI family sensor histidine kinase inhibitor